MKILLLIDSLGSGGAQRQLVALAVGLKKRGHAVRVLVYHPHDHFLPLLHSASILCEIIPYSAYWRRVLGIRRILRRGWQDVVLAFLEAPCFYAELARMPRQQWGLVVGERSADPEIRTIGARFLRQGHRLADAVITNSHTNRLMLREALPFLQTKLATIYNTVDMELFRPKWEIEQVPQPEVGLACRIVVAASYQVNKNMLGLAKALLCLKNSGTPPLIVVDWYGAVQDPVPYDAATRFVDEYGLSESFRFHKATRAIQSEFANADAVGLFSFFEGLPNSVCEGMASGKPILLSDVCDAGSLVREGQNGFLFDPASPESIAKAIRKMASLSPAQRRGMGEKSRRMAEVLFDESLVLDRYEQALQAACRREAVPRDCSWPTDVPDSAIRTANDWAKSGRFDLRYGESVSS